MEKRIILVLAVLALVGFLGGLYLTGTLKFPTQNPSASCPTPSIVYVYETEAQKNAADSITSTFKTVLNNYGINIINVPVCTIPASALPQKLRVYPALLYKGNISALRMYTTGSIGDYNILAPTISATFAYYQGVKVTFGVTVEALIVEGSSPYSKLNVSDETLKDMLAQVAIANIAKITRVKPEEIGVTPLYLPTTVFKSDYNLSQGVKYLVKLKDNIYGLSNETQLSLLSYLGISVYEIRTPPAPILNKGVPYGSNATVTLYLLEDYHCPFCADLFNSVGNEFQSIVRQGKLQLVFVDLIVHPEVIEMHAFTKCIYNMTGSGEVYFNITRDLYRIGTSTTINDSKSIALRYLSQGIVTKAQECANATVNDVRQNAQQITSIGFTGTPTLIFWNNSTRKGIVIEGCLQVHPCLTQQQLEQILAWLGS
ncbi:MAG: thioredoxin domain-containing protein [Infirmifilum sp.]